MELLPGVRARMVSSGRLRTHLLESGPDTGTPLVLVHGNLSTGRFFEHLMPDLAGAGYRVLAPDMRSFGRSEAAPIDATRGLDDWADDIAALLAALGIAASAHLVGWSTGGAAIARFAQLHRVASLTLIDPVSPFGYGGVRDDGSLIHHDAAGSGAAGVAAEFVQRLRDHDTSADSPLSPRSFLREAYWSPHHRLSPDREDLLVEEILMSALGNGVIPARHGPPRTGPASPPETPASSTRCLPNTCAGTASSSSIRSHRCCGYTVPTTCSSQTDRCWRRAHSARPGPSKDGQARNSSPHSGW
jgi:pimeloyl-ACP methyl ester carboxylesterase